jgi:hypothetical protein
METQGGEEIQILLIHELGTRWGWVVSVTPRQSFTPGERIHGTHLTGGWVGSRASLDLKARGKIILHRLGIKPESPGPPVGSQPPKPTDWATPAPQYKRIGWRVCIMLFSIIWFFSTYLLFRISCVQISFSTLFSTLQILQIRFTAAICSTREISSTVYREQFAKRRKYF